MAVTLIRPDGASLTFDAVLSESWDVADEVSSHTLEDGESVSDHARAVPVRVTLAVEQTHTPYTGQGSLTEVGQERATATLRWLEAARRQALTLVSDRQGTWTDMVIRAMPHTVDAVAALPISLTLEQVRFATAQTVQIPPAQPVARAQAGAPSEQQVGQQATTATGGDAKEARDKSWLLSALQGTGVL